MTATAKANGTISAAYEAAGVSTAEAESGLRNIVRRITQTWPRGEFGRVHLPIGYFANVVQIDDRTGVAVCTDGVGTKAIIARLMDKYDTIGIDCIAMNVNDLICVGAVPVSLVDYIGIQRVDARILDQIAIGLTNGAIEAEISISGGEIAQLPEIINGFDLIGTAVGRVDLDKILWGQDIREGDVVIGIASNGIHSNGLTLARRAFLEFGGHSLDDYIPDFGTTLGEELLRPTYIHVRECMEILSSVAGVKALINVTSDGLNNLTRVSADVSFEIDQFPIIPPVFQMIQKLAQVDESEMFEVFNMGIGFCLVVEGNAAARTISILEKHNRTARPIGRAVNDKKRQVRLPQFGLEGENKAFRFIKSHARAQR